MKNTLAMIMLLAAYGMSRIPVHALNRASVHVFGALVVLQLTFWLAYAAQCARDFAAQRRALSAESPQLG